MAKVACETNLLKSVTVSRLMGPNDANVYGNVHGGIILKHIEEAGTIIASRYCNNAPNKDRDQDDTVAGLARIEHMDFLLPMHIGEVAEFTAEIVFTSQHSLEVVVDVWAENIIKGIIRLTNRARLWYVPMSIINPDKVLSVPPMTYENSDDEERGRTEYERQKAHRKERESNNIPQPVFIPGQDAEPNTVAYSQTCLSVIVGVNDVTFTKHCSGGVLLKLMDECAGVTSRRHCHNICVTACLGAINFHEKIPLGSLVHVKGWVVFTSSRSMIIEVVVEFEGTGVFSKGIKRVKAIDSFFTFVAISQEGKPQPVPPLKVQTDEERERFKVGEERYKRQRIRKQQSLHEQQQVEAKIHHP